MSTEDTRQPPTLDQLEIALRTRGSYWGACGYEYVPLTTAEQAALVNEIAALRQQLEEAVKSARRLCGEHGRIEVYQVEPDEDGGDWHTLTFEDGWKVAILTTKPLVIIEPQKN